MPIGRGINFVNGTPEWLVSKLALVRANPSWITWEGLSAWLSSVGISLDAHLAGTTIDPARVRSLLASYRAYPSKLTPISLAINLDRLNIRLRLNMISYPYRIENLVDRYFRRSLALYCRENWLAIYWLEQMCNLARAEDLPKVNAALKQGIYLYKVANYQLFPGYQYSEANPGTWIRNLVGLTVKAGWLTGVWPKWYVGEAGPQGVTGRFIEMDWNSFIDGDYRYYKAFLPADFPVGKIPPVHSWNDVVNMPRSVSIPVL